MKCSIAAILLTLSLVSSYVLDDEALSRQRRNTDKKEVSGRFGFGGFGSPYGGTGGAGLGIVGGFLASGLAGGYGNPNYGVRPNNNQGYGIGNSYGANGFGGIGPGYGNNRPSGIGGAGFGFNQGFNNPYAPTQSPVVSFQAVGPNNRPAFSVAGNEYGFYFRNKNKKGQPKTKSD